jgi:hypothetical protein
VHPADCRRAIGPVCAARSIRRRLRAVRAALRAVVTLLPELLAGVAPTVTALRHALGTDRVLVTVRGLAARHVSALPTPLGLHTRVGG